MKDEIKKLFNDCLTGGAYSHVYSANLKFYSQLQSLSGYVYEQEVDNHMDKELSELSNYVQFLANSEKTKDLLKQLLPSEMDLHRMFDTGLDYRHQNLTEVTINFPQTINLPGISINQEKSEEIINLVLEEFKTVKTYEFSVPKIIGWIKMKVDTIEKQ